VRACVRACVRECVPLRLTDQQRGPQPTGCSDCVLRSVVKQDRMRAAPIERKAKVYDEHVGARIESGAFVVLLLHDEVAAGEVAVRDAGVVQQCHAAANRTRQRRQQSAVQG
jgi:hypothetical protein